MPGSITLGLEDHFGSMVQTIRQSQGLTQVELSRLSGLAQSQLSLLEKHAEPPTVRIMRKVLNALGKTRMEITW